MPNYQYCSIPGMQTAARVGGGAVVARDHVDEQMEDGLSLILWDEDPVREDRMSIGSVKKMG